MRIVVTAPAVTVYIHCWRFIVQSRANGGDRLDTRQQKYANNILAIFYFQNIFLAVRNVDDCYSNEAIVMGLTWSNKENSTRHIWLRLRLSPVVDTADCRPNHYSSASLH